MTIHLTQTRRNNTTEHRDGGVLQLIAGQDVKRVLEYMQNGVAPLKLMGVAESASKIARLLWSEFPQEPVPAVALQAD